MLLTVSRFGECLNHGTMVITRKPFFHSCPANEDGFELVFCASKLYMTRRDGHRLNKHEQNSLSQIAISSLIPVAEVDHMSLLEDRFSLHPSQHVLFRLVTPEHNKAFEKPRGRLSNATKMYSIRGAS